MTTPAEPRADAAAPPAPLRLLFSREHPPGALARAERAGRIVRLARGVYCASPPPGLPRWRQHLLVHDARVLALSGTLPEDSVIGGYSAARVLGAALLTTPTTIDVHSPHANSSTQRTRGFHRHVRRLRDDEVTRVDGITVTSHVRTAVDCARQGSPAEAMVAIDSLIRLVARPHRKYRAESQQRIDAVMSQLHAVVERETGYRNNARARTLLRWCDGWAESALESRTRRAALIVGLPRPLSQFPVTVRNNTYYPDLAFTLRTVDGTFVLDIEADGMTKFETGYTADRERRRDADLRSIGHEVLHVSTEMVRDPALAEFRDLLRHKLPPEVRRSLRPVRELMTERERRVVDRQPWPFRD